MADFKEREMMNVYGNVVGDIKTDKFEWNGEDIDVTNFALVSDKNDKKVYTNCSAYNKWAEPASKLEKGELIHVFRYIKERKHKEKIYKNFIVMHMNKVEKTEEETENKEEK